METFTYGELIVMELFLAEKIKEMDLSMQSGQFIVALLGKIEYQIGQLTKAINTQMPLENPDALNPKAG